ncbi:MAG TPA: alpha/beta hydrolase [Chloroflexota bacterium]|nr:alpha/beta hydrolase [Chloroflexota bacterium]
MKKTRPILLVAPHHRSLITGLILVLVLLGAGLGVKTKIDAQTPDKASFVNSTCPFKIAPGVFPSSDVRCGFLQVPENRQAAPTRTIRLAVAVFKSQAPHPAAAPFIYLAGGPGSPIVTSMGSSVAAGGIPAYVGNRDLVLVDQRGTGLSRPSLMCPEFDAVGRGATKQPLSQAKAFALEHAAIRKCRARLVRAGIDLNAYNTAENAADIADLWQALGYRQANVYGGSYGARLALQVMRDHPDGVRSVVVDAVADPTFNQYNDEIPNAWRAIELVFKRCAAASGCHAAYPHLEAMFNSTVNRLQAHPITGHELIPKWGKIYPVKINGARFAADMMAALYSPSLIPSLPGLIANTFHGNNALLFKVDAAIYGADTGSSEGMYLSMECADDQAGSSPSRIAASAAPIPRSIRSDAVASASDALTLCKIWNVRSLPAVNRQLFASAIPTLLLEGSFDPRTPPARAQAAARKLSHGYYFEFPSLGHGVVGQGPCSDEIVSAFLTDPSRRPNANCIAKVPSVFR